VAVSSVTSNAIQAYFAQGQNQPDDTQSSPLAALQRKESSAITQLSAYGQVKSALSDLQARAQALENQSKTTTPTMSDLKSAVQDFVKSYNALNATVTVATADTQQTQGALANDLRVAQALSAVSKAAAGANNEATRALQKIGIVRQSDGTLAVNQNTLENAFNSDRANTLSTLSEVGSRVNQATGQQLNGNVGAKVNSLTSLVNELDTQRTTLQARVDAQKNIQQLQAAQLAAINGFSARNAVATYFGVASI